MASNIIAQLKAMLSFDIDDRKLREFEKKMKHAHKRINDTGERLHKDIKRNTKTQLGGMVAIEKRLNKHRGQIFQLRKDYWQVNQEYKRGNLSLERRNRLLTEMHTKYRSVQRQAKLANAEIDRNPIARTRRAFNNRQGGLSGGGAGVRTGVAAGGSAALISRAFPAAVVGAAAFGGAVGMAGSNRQYQQFESVRSSMLALEGSAEAANNRLRELAGMSEYFGLNFMTTIEGFRSFALAFKGTAVENLTSKMYRQMNSFATAMGLNAQRIGGMQLAFGQIAANDR